MEYDLTDKLIELYAGLKYDVEWLGNLPFDYNTSEEFIDKAHHLEHLLDKVADEVYKLQKLSRKEGY